MVAQSAAELLEQLLEIDPDTPEHARDYAVAMHTVTATASSWDSGNVAAGGTFTRRFDTPGTFSYFCTIHGAAVMSGTVTVNS